MDQTPPGLEDEHEAVLSFLYMCPTGILQTNNDGTVQMLNPMASQLLMPLAPGGLIANLFDVLQSCAPDLRNLVDSYSRSRGRICDNHRLFIGDLAGQPRVLGCTMLRVDPRCIMVMLNDISEQVAQERRLKQADAWLNAIFTNVSDFAFFTLDEAGLINCWSPSGLLQTGYTEAEVLGHTLDIFQPPEGRIQAQTSDQIACARREGFHLYEGRCSTRRQQSVWWQILITAVKDNDNTISGFTVVLRDVTERKMTSDQLRRLLTTDHLTGAANRARFFEMATTEFARWQRHAQPFSVIMMDADHFKDVNDKFGHDAGDCVLKTLVSRCMPILRTNDLLARYGGEEFVIMLPGTDSAGALDLSERVRRAIADAPVAFNSVQIGVTVSLGCATLGQEVDELDMLLKAADVAMYRSKQLGRNQSHVYQPVDMRPTGRLQSRETPAGVAV